MTEELRNLRNITKDFAEVQMLIKEHNSLKKKIRSIDRKLKTIESQYRFLNDITSVDGSSTLIEIAAKKLFKNIGFTDVRHLQDAKPQREGGCKLNCVKFPVN